MNVTTVRVVELLRQDRVLHVDIVPGTLSWSCWECPVFEFLSFVFPHAQCLHYRQRSLWFVRRSSTERNADHQQGLDGIRLDEIWKDNSRRKWMDLETRPWFPRFLRMDQTNQMVSDDRHGLILMNRVENGREKCKSLGDVDGTA